MAGKKTLIKIANPKEGVSQKEYEAICKAIGIEPKPPTTSTSDDKQSAPTDSTPLITDVKEVP